MFWLFVGKEGLTKRNTFFVVLLVVVGELYECMGTQTPLTLEERADLSPYLVTASLNSSMRVVGTCEVTPVVPTLMGSYTVMSSVHRICLPGY